MKQFSDNADYYDALKRITQYETVERLRRNAEKQYGITGEEAIEYAYENVIQEARNAIRGKRRPKGAERTDSTSTQDGGRVVNSGKGTGKQPAGKDSLTGEGRKA